jgi:hypothetical protein
MRKIRTLHTLVLGDPKEGGQDRDVKNTSSNATSATKDATKETRKSST